MTITVTLSSEQEGRLAEHAAQVGQDLVGYVHRLLERDIEGPAAMDEALAPFRRQVEESGMSDEELRRFFEEVREEVRQEKQAGAGPRVMRPRVVFDGMVYLQAAAQAAGPAAACLQAARAGRLELVTSPEIITEVRDVLTRPKTLRKFPALTSDAVEVFLQDVIRHAVLVSGAPMIFRHEGAPEVFQGELTRVVLVPGAPMVFRYEGDPKDEPYVNLALALGAVYLASWDRDSFDLISGPLRQSRANSGEPPCEERGSDLLSALLQGLFIEFPK
jgi:predicted nucleic acid-binding protein/ribosomal protein S21